jgi:BirA family biotin operon repressor/biotin-[acetyl-CoA-carboxylase] ligase
MSLPVPHEYLDEAALRAALPGWNVIYRSRTTSTNDEARRLAVQGAPDRTVVLAEEQTAGRGRRGARWVSPVGRNGIVSVLCRPGKSLPPERWARLTLAAALAGCGALDAVPGLGAAAEVKWPNDLYLSGRKVAGILVESAWAADGGFVVVGTGFNLNLRPEEFPEELRDTATSVWMERGGLTVDRTVFLTNYLRALEKRQAQAAADFEAMKDEAWRRSWLAGKRVTLTSAGEETEGVVCGLGPEGELLLKRDDGAVQIIASAELVRPCPD